MRRVVVGVLMVLVLSGCDRPSAGQTDQPPRYASGRDVRNALVRSGLGCDAFQVVRSHSREYGEEDAVETDTCRVSNEDASISIWRGLGQKQDWARTRATLGCEFADTLRSGPPVYVDGGLWTVRVTSRMVATRISEAIGGQPRFTDCRSVG